MKPIHLKNTGLAWISLLLALPTAYFLVISVLKYELGFDEPFDASIPFLEKIGIKETLGGNINLLILLGPIIALALSIFQVLRIKFQFTQNHFLFQIILKKRWLPLLVAAFSISLLGILFIYLVGENCNG
jgi:hypothetical protein